MTKKKQPKYITNKYGLLEKANLELSENDKQILNQLKEMLKARDSKA